jgi:hypothetical protein
MPAQRSEAPTAKTVCVAGLLLLLYPDALLALAVGFAIHHIAGWRRPVCLVIGLLLAFFPKGLMVAVLAVAIYRSLASATTTGCQDGVSRSQPQTAPRDVQDGGGRA